MVGKRGDNVVGVLERDLPVQFPTYKLVQGLNRLPDDPGPEPSVGELYVEPPAFDSRSDVRRHVAATFLAVSHARR